MSRGSLPRVRMDRFWNKVEKTDSCWLWTGALTGCGRRTTSNGGYGSFGFEGRNVSAHRFAYELLIGPIPDGLTLDHLCRNRACVNPDHLEPISLAENIRRGDAGWRGTDGHCRRGHALTTDNIYLATVGYPRCRTCRSVSGRKRRKRPEVTP